MDQPARFTIDIAPYNVVRWTDFSRGGHFAALETGAVLADDLRAFVAQL